MSESSRKAVVVPVELKTHTNADSLSLVSIEGFQCVVNTAQWAGINKAFYLEPETIVNTTKPEFSFLKRENRDKEIIRARRIRGEWSVGLLIPAPDNFQIGDDGWEYLGLEHYEPEEEVEGMKSGYSVPAPVYWASLGKYNLENYKKYRNVLRDGELISLSEKMNGANQSVVYSDGQFHVKSRNLWKKEDEFCDFWKALNKNESLKKYLQDNPDHLVQGEMVGKVKGFLYGLNGPEFRAFDIRTPDYKFMDPVRFQDTCGQYNIKTPRVFLHSVPYCPNEVLSFVDGEQDNNPKGIREGVVLKTCDNRYEPRLMGRVALKIVSNIYLEKSGK